MRMNTPMSIYQNLAIENRFLKFPTFQNIELQASVNALPRSLRDLLCLTKPTQPLSRNTTVSVIESHRVGFAMPTMFVVRQRGRIYLT